MELDLVSPAMTQPFSAALNASYDYCRQVVRDSGSNFYAGMRLTPSPKREAIYSIYAWMREVDDIADEVYPKKEKYRRLIKYYRLTQMIIENNTSSETLIDAGNHWLAFRDTILTYQIPLVYFKEMVLGQLHVISNRPIKTFNELYKYCYRVASTVGLILIQIWGYRNSSKTEKFAEYRGIAFQLTNILRDLQEDERDGISYVPLEWQEQISTTPNVMSREIIDRLIEKAAHYYQASKELEQFVHSDGYLCLRVMTEFYYALFKKIRQKPERLFEKERVSIHFYKKVFLTLKTWIGSKLAKRSIGYD